MCGINVIYNFNDKRIDVDDLKRMSSVIAHRGPDETGFAVLNNGKVGLAHVRLSIIDLARGQQPLYNEDQSIAITYNGEIYDHMELRQDMIKRGHQFRTTSDTEVIVHLYEEFGLDFFDKLNGEFAFVIWDQKKDQLLMVRDRLGIKPLFYYFNNHELIISSEVKGILATGRVEAKISNDYITGPMIGSMTNKQEIFENIHCLRPGNYITIFKNSPVKERPYWRMKFDVDKNMSFEDATEGVRYHFEKAVSRRMVADVPVGNYLSGGVDSTLVCAMMTKQHEGIKSFNVGFGNSEMDESSIARKIAQFYNAGYESFDCSMERLAQNYIKSMYHLEQVIVNLNSVAKIILSAEIHKQGYKVCLTGEGSDEILAGYAYFKLEKLWRMLSAGGEEARDAKFLLKKFRKIEKRSEGFLWNRSDKWKKTETAFGYPCFHIVRAEMASQLMNWVLNKDALGLKQDQNPVDFFYKNFKMSKMRKLHPLNAAREISLEQLSGYVIPMLGDRTEMANSVECRTPFMDRDLLEFSGKIPPEFFLDIYKLREKNILHGAFKKIIPPFIHNEYKHPFLSPDWRKFYNTRTGREIVEEHLSRKAVKNTGILNHNTISLLLAAWKKLPQWSTVWKQTEMIIGLALSTQVLHKTFVQNKITGDRNFQMVDRSPSCQ